ncbi:MAG: hypothetical protein ACKOQY_00540 [Bacteroidota bacterium]
MGNLYVVSGAEIQKFSPSGAPGVRYSRKDLGTPTSIDVSNPLRILIFYAEFALINITDNNLVDQSEIDLRSLGYLQPRAAAIAPDQGIWIFDEIIGALIKIDTRLQSAAISVDLIQLLGYRPQIREIATSRDWVIARDDSLIHVFDLFGTKSMSIPIQSKPVLCQLIEGTLLFSQGEELVRTDLRTRTEQRSPLPCPSASERTEWIDNRCRYMVRGNLYMAR